MTKKVLFLSLVFVIFFNLSAFAKPKYGPKAIPLSFDQAYLKKAAAPDFWALMPYYTAQQSGSACSIASVTMLLNALRVGAPLTTDDELVTQPGLIKKTGDAAWANSGVVLDELGDKVRASLKAYGLEKYSAKVIHVNAALTKKKFVEMLVANERSRSDVILINYIQGSLTDDSPIGHIAPIGAYDAKTDRVLVLDPDREWYEPYWSKSADVLAGMQTEDKLVKKNRGLVWVRKE